jgi:hypothetical protein
VRILVIPFLVVVGLLLIALVLPSKRDTSVAAWWTRVRYQANYFARVALVLAGIGALVWYVVLPLFGWRLMGLGD